jgi:excisionase family DNA binding protein
MNLQEAADALGVHYQTLYRWVRSGAIPAAKRGSSYDIDPAELERFRNVRQAETPPPQRLQVRDWDAQVDRFHAALLDGDELGARTIVDRLSAGGLSLAEICDRLIGPALARIGQAWHDGELTIAEEHRATAICERIIGRLAGHPRGRPRGVAVVATVPGDLHGLPSTMAAMALREDHWKVHHIGPDVPEDDLVRLVHDESATLVVLSSTTGSTATDLVTRLEGDGVRVLVGAPGKRLADLVELARSR